MLSLYLSEHACNCDGEVAQSLFGATDHTDIDPRVFVCRVGNLHDSRSYLDTSAMLHSHISFEPVDSSRAVCVTAQFEHITRF